MEKLGIDEMDSLFEGMVLFNPSSTQTQIKPEEENLQNNHHRSPDPDPDPDPDPNPNPNPIEVISSIRLKPSSSSSSLEPLDENLFSDLTLFHPPQSHDSPLLLATYTSTSAFADAKASTSVSVSVTPSPTPPSAVPQPLSRQSSSTRKKKRVGGLRVGYGRERDTTQIRVEQPILPHSSSPSSISVQKHEPPRQPQEEEREEDAAAAPSVSSETASVHSDNIAIGETTSVVMEEEDDSINITSTTTTTPISETEKVDHPPTSSIDVVLHDSDGQDVATAEKKAIEQADDTENSIELRYESIMAQISNKLNNAKEKVASLSATRKKFIRKRRKALEDLILATTKYKEMEKQMEEAVESEDFETAESVSESLVSAERNKQLLATALRDAESNCDAVDSEMQQVVELQIAAEQECASLLHSFSMDAAHHADSVLASAESLNSEETEKWLSSAEGLEVKRMELEIESHVVHEARVVLDDSIEDSVKDDREQRELLHREKEKLMGELQSLLALVKQKEIEIAENDSNLEKVDKRIAGAVSCFQDAQSSFHSKLNNLRSGLSQLELDNEALSRKKKEIDDLLFQEEVRGSKIMELSRISADEANIYQEFIHLRKSLVQFISKSREDKSRLTMAEEQFSEDVQMLKQDVSAARALLQDLSSTKSRIQQEIESLKQRLLFIDKRAPELESEKKVAAAARNFKEAARIATEVKELYIEKESLQTKTEESTLELKKVEEDISHNVNRLQEIEDQISSKEKELAIARYQRLLIIAAAATAERSAAIDLGDLEEADILLAEAQAADAEAKKLQPIYNLSEEEFKNVPKQFIPIELVSTLGREQLAELAASAHISVSL